MSQTTSVTILEQLKWRYATKRFDPNRKVPEQDWKAIEQALLLSPSSYGLQPWKFVVVLDPAVRKQLHAVSFGQPQILDASHLIVVTSKNILDKAYIEHWVARVAEVRSVSKESLNGFRDVMLGDPKFKEGAETGEWGARQAYIALGMALSAAALLGVDACPMEGFQNKDYDIILGLDKEGYSSRALCAVGYRSPEDKYAEVPKARFPLEEIVRYV